MAVKFSQFVVETNKANVNYLVGWDGVENVQITPSDLLSGFNIGSTNDVAYFASSNSVIGDATTPFVYQPTGGGGQPAGRLGLGTSSPNFKMDISGGDLRFENNDGIRFGGTGSNNTNWRIFTTGTTTGNLSIGNSASTPYLTISRGSSTTGFVGIGTSSPGALLQVDGTFISSGLSQLGSGGANVLLTSSSAGNVGIGTSSPSEKLSLPDNAKIGLGNSADLQIYHDGSNSYIQDSGTGDLRVRTNRFVLNNANDTENLIRAEQNSSVELFHDNSKKLETTSSGVQVIGSTTILGTNTFLIESNSTAATFNLNSSSRGFDFINNNATLLSLASNGDATFAGYVTTDDLRINTTSQLFSAVATFNGDTYTTGGYKLGTSTTYVGKIHNNSGKFTIEADGDRDILIGSSNNTNVISIDTSALSTTFAGNLTVIGSTTMAGLNPSSVTTPLIRLQGDLNVLNKAQTSYLTLADRDTSGSEVVYNLSNLGTATFAGNVQVGTSFSSQKNIYFGDSNFSIRTENNYTASNLDNLRFAVADNSDAGFRFTNVNDDELLYIKSANGNIGIGTTSPEDILDIVGRLRISDNKTADTNKTNRIRGEHYDIAEEPTTILFTNNFETTNSLFIGGGSSIENASTEIKFFTASNNTTTSGTERMRITSAGHVGIGTTSPNGVLDVLSTDAQRFVRFRAPNGEERFEFHIGSTGNGARLSMFDHDGTTEGVRLSASGNSYLNNNSKLGIGTTSPGVPLDVVGLIRTTTSFVGNACIVNSLTSATSGDSIHFKNNSGVIHVTLTDSGNLGIGTTGPASKLEVDGGDIEVDDSGSGLILRSPDGTRYRVTVANGGTLSVSAV